MRASSPPKPAAVDLAFFLVVVYTASSAAGALILAELGALRPGALVLDLVVACAMTAVAALRLRRSWACATRSAGAFLEAAVPAVLLLVGAVLFTPPLRTILWAGDATVYPAYGQQVARSGGLVFGDELLRSVAPERRQILFRNTSPDDLTGETARLPGGIAIADMSNGRVRAGFAPLFPVLIAVFVLLSGPDAAFWVTPVFGAGGVLATYFFGRALGGVVVGAIGALLLAISLPQIWFSRIALSAVIAQFLLVGGLWLALLFARCGGTVVAVAAAGVLGVSATAGPDVLVTVILVVATFAAVTLLRGRRIEGGRRFIAALATVLGAVLASFLLGSSNYGTFFDRRLQLLPLPAAVKAAIAATPAWMALAACALAAGVLLVGLARWEASTVGHPARRRRLGLLACGTVAVALLTYLAPLRSRIFDTIAWVAAYMSWPLLLLAVACVAAVVLRAVRGDAGDAAEIVAALAVASLLVLYNPQLQDVGVHPGTVRRLVPLVFPAVATAAALALVGAIRHRPPRVRIAGGGLAVILLASLIAQPSLAVVGTDFGTDDEGAADAFAEELPPNAVVLVSPELAGTHVQARFTLVHERSAMIMDSADDAPDLPQDQILDWLAQGRPVFLLASNDGVHLRGPRLHLAEQSRFVITASVLSDAAAPPRRVESRRIELGAYRLSARREPATVIDVGNYASDATARMTGFYGGERDAGDVFRWTGARATIEVPAGHVVLVLSGARPAGVAAAAVTITWGDGEAIELAALPDAPTRVVVDVTPPDQSRPGSDVTTLVIEATTFNPRRAGLSDDDRELGARLYRVEIPTPSEPAAADRSSPPPGDR